MQVNQLMWSEGVAGVRATRHHQRMRKLHSSLGAPASFAAALYYRTAASLSLSLYRRLFHGGGNLRDPGA